MNFGENNRFKIGAVIVAVLGLLAAGWLWGRPAYRQLKEQRRAAEATAFFEQGKYRNASLSARLTLMLNSNNIPACRVMAGLAELSRSPATLDWRQRIEELQPTVENQLALAASALQFQNPPFPLTTQILDQLANRASNLPSFQVVATGLALRQNRVAEAASHMATAISLEPTNLLFQLNLAVLQLGSTNADVVTAARTKLDQFRANPQLGPSALRSLVADRLGQADLPAARSYSTQLLATAQAGLPDRLQYLGILKRLKSSELPVQLQAVQKESATNAALAAQTAAWMQAGGFLAETGPWLTALPAGIQSAPAVQLALVDYYFGTTNWTGLRQLTARGDWGELDFLRLAFLSHAWQELGEAPVADSQWKSAVDAAGDRLGALNALLDLAGRWNQTVRQEQLLWKILRRYPDAAWAQRALEQIYLAAGDTPKLYQLYAEQLPRLPKNRPIKNNLVATALLLKTNLAQSFQWAAEVYAQQTNDPVIVSTYAYAEHLQGRDAGGLTAFRNLSAAQLEQPSVALYYGVLLAATGKTDEAAPYLRITQNLGLLLPEEKQLLAELLK